ncbi:MAG: C-type lectin domain-containing protein [Polyangiaceae bacterium]
MAVARSLRLRGAFVCASLVVSQLGCSSPPDSGLFDASGGGASLVRGGAASTNGGSTVGVSSGGATSASGGSASSGGVTAASGGASTSASGGATASAGAAAGGSATTQGGSVAAQGGAVSAQGGATAQGGTTTAQGGTLSGEGGLIGSGGSDSSGGVDQGGSGSGGAASGGAVSSGGAASGGAGSGGGAGCSASATEVCDGVDNNCNDMIDEKVCPTRCTGFVAAGGRYMACNVTVNQNNAETMCEKQGMRLAWLDSADKQSAVFTAIQKLGGAGPASAFTEVYIGATDAEAEGHWHWIGGSDFWLGTGNGSAVDGAYSNWASGRPNNYPAIPGEDCGVLVIDYPSDGNPGQWNDVACSEMHGVLCEAP